VFWRRKGGDIMVNKKDLIIAVLATFCLTSTLFSIIPTRSSPAKEYNPIADLTGPEGIPDGRIDMRDIGYVCNLFGATGTPVNWTKLIEDMNELQSRVNALESRIPKKGYISISPTAFTPSSNTQSYYKYYCYLRGQGELWASLQLPDGATVTNMTVLLWDSSNTGRIEVYLAGFNITEGYPLTIFMAGVATTDSGTPGEVILYDDTISDAIIDNRNCEYALLAYFSKDDISLVIEGIVLEYEYP